MADFIETQNPWWNDPTARPEGPRSHRSAFSHALSWAETIEERALVILGPRQVGKTTVLRQVVSKCLRQGLYPPGNVLYFDFADDRAPRAMAPDEVISLLPPSHDPSAHRLIVLDEVGDSGSDWSRWLKRRVDEERRREGPKSRFLLTDSSAQILRAGGRESGPGRWDELLMEPLSFKEYCSLLGVDKFATPDPFESFFLTGGFPEHLMALDANTAWRKIRTDIADRSIIRDLQRTGIDVIKALDLFRRLVQSSGDKIVISNLAQDMDDTKATTVTGWLQHLLDTCLLHDLPPWGGAKKSRRGTKYFAADHGIVNAFAPTTRPREDTDTVGRVFETMVFRQLRELQRNAHISYFDHHGDADFVVDFDNTTVAIQVTSSSSPSAKKAQQVLKAGRRLKADRCLVISNSAVESTVEDVPVVPIREFLLSTEAALLGELS